MGTHLLALTPGPEIWGRLRLCCLSFLAEHRGDPQPPNTSRPALLRLSDHLLANYKKGVRPVRDWRTPTTVSIDVIVYAILSVVSARPHCPAPGWTF